MRRIVVALLSLSLAMPVVATPATGENQSIIVKTAGNLSVQEHIDALWDAGWATNLVDGDWAVITPLGESQSLPPMIVVPAAQFSASEKARVPEVFSKLLAAAPRGHGDGTSVPDRVEDYVIPSEKNAVIIGDDQASTLRTRCRWTNCYLKGLVRYNMIFPESSLNSPNRYTFTSGEVGVGHSDIVDGLYALSQTAAGRGISLTFERGEMYTPVTYLDSADPEVFVNVEPADITSPAWFEANVADPIMTALGYAYGTTKEKITRLNSEVQAGLFDGGIGSAHAFTFFIVDNGSESDLAFAALGGPYSTLFLAASMTQTLRSIAAHETIHIFWGCDEYAGCPAFCENCAPYHSHDGRLGPRPTAENGNCVYQATCSTTSVSCLMRDTFSGSLSSYPICDYTARQVGW